MKIECKNCKCELLKDYRGTIRSTVAGEIYCDTCHKERQEAIRIANPYSDIIKY